MRIDRIPIFFFLCIQVTIAHAQVAQSGRFEIPLYDNSSKPYAVSGLGKNGLLIYGSVLADGVEAVELIRVDTTLNELWRGYIKLESHFNIVMAQSTEEKA